MVRVMVPGGGPLHKDRNPVSFVPLGPDLARLVMELRREGRPVWRVASLAAPRIESAPVTGPDRRAEFTSGELLVLESPDPTYWTMTNRGQGLRPNELKHLLWMQAAILHDIQKMSEDELSDVIFNPASALEGVSARNKDGKTLAEVVREKAQTREDPVRQTREIVRKGRLIWRRLPAWPWSWFDPPGRPPGDWWSKGPDATLAAAFETWASD